MKDRLVVVVWMKRGRAAGGELPKKEMKRKWTEEEWNRGERGREAL